MCLLEEDLGSIWGDASFHSHPLQSSPALETNLVMAFFLPTAAEREPAF